MNNPNKQMSVNRVSKKPDEFLSFELGVQLYAYQIIIYFMTLVSK